MGFHFINQKPIAGQACLYRQLEKQFKGLGLRNSLQILANCIQRECDLRKLTVDDLTVEQLELINKVLTSSQIDTKNYMHILRLGAYLKAYHESTKVRLTRMKCRTGLRHKVGLRVNGQRTRTTGRKNKKLKGFQKKDKKDGKTKA